MTARDDIEAVAGGVLREHELHNTHWSIATCSCDQWTSREKFYEAIVADFRAHLAAILAEALTANTIERLTRVLGCHPGARENDGTPCASGLHSPALWGADGCTWVAEVAECLGEIGVGT